MTIKAERQRHYGNLDVVYWLEDPRAEVHYDDNLCQRTWAILPPPEEAVIPDWMHSISVDWSDGYSNEPEFKCLYNSGMDPHRFADEPIWRLSKTEIGYWRAYAADGRATQHKHSGTLTWNETLQQWETTQQDGYAKRHFPILMDPTSDPRFAAGPNGEPRNKVVLKGPWHTGMPNGYQPMSTKEYKADDAYGCYCFGLEVSLHLIANCFHALMPGYQLAVVRGYNKRISLQALKPTWDAPKTVWLRRQGKHQER